MIAAIAAVAQNGMLGRNGWLPWDIPEELAYFEQTIAGSALLIGRLTYESMVEVPAPAFILSQGTGLVLKPGCRQVNSLREGLLSAQATGKNVFVLGGASVYRAVWPYCDRFYLTRIAGDFAGDTLFPADIPLHRWHIAADDTRWLLEQASQQTVACRFMQYVQDSPERLV